MMCRRWSRRCSIASSRSGDGVTEGTETFDDPGGATQDAARGSGHCLSPEQRLRQLQAGIHAIPDGFSPNAKLKRTWDKRAKTLDDPDGRIDWAHAEALAFAAILDDGTPIRLTGQDAQRGTFSQRHLVLHDAKTGDDVLAAPCACRRQRPRSASTTARSQKTPALASSTATASMRPRRWCCGKAQFGDFANGAQIIIDQFLSRRPRQVGTGTVARAAASTWLRGPGPGALQRPPRTLPPALGA